MVAGVGAGGGGTRGSGWSGRERGGIDMLKVTSSRLMKVVDIE